MHGAPFIQDLALVLCVAAVTSVLFRRLRQPVVLGYLLAGLVVGPHTTFPLFADVERVNTLSELGVILVMFSIGLEFSLKKLARVLLPAGTVAAVQIGAMFWLGHLAALALGWSTRESLFAGAMVSISSTVIVAKVFDERPVGAKLEELVFGVLIVEDVAAILFIALLTAIATGVGQPTEVALATIGRLSGFLFVLVAGGYLVVPRVVRAVARLASLETLLVASVGLCFAFALLAEKSGYSVALGAFVAGALVAESRRQRQVEPLVRPLRDLFGAVFFVSVGMHVDPLEIALNWPALVLFVVVVVVGKIVSVTLGAFLVGHELPTAIRAGMSLGHIGEFSFILAGAGVAAGAIDPTLYSVAVGVSVVTTYLTPGLVARSERAALWVEHRLPKPLRTFASLYGSWIERLRAGARSGQAGRPRLKLARHAGWLVLDVVCFAGVVIATSLFLERLAQRLGESSGASHSVARALVLGAGAAVALPFGIGIVRLSRALGAEIAAEALPPQAGGAPDFAAAPRRAFVVALQLAIVILVGGPLLALTQPFVPVLYEAGVVLVGLGLLTVVFWRRANALEAHVRAGAQVVVEALQRQNPGEDETPSLVEVQPLLPGLGEIAPVRVEPGCLAVGQTLAHLDLRARTGASVIAITREGQGIVTPTGREALHAGDVLALTGSQEALNAARALLAQRGGGRRATDRETSP